MNDIDLTKILKDCPRCTKLYSTIYGEVELDKIKKESEYPIILSRNDGSNFDVTADGKYLKDWDGECTLFPSREQRDWSKFTAPWYKNEKASSQTNERTWLYLVSDVLTWKDGIGQYLDDTRVQELAKRLCSEYLQKLYSPSNAGKNEQKSADKIKPKIKVGDWVVNDYCRGRVVELTDDAYLLDTGQGIPFSCEHNAHLWTIQDAKDGDVLCCKSGWMCIFKAINNHTNTFSSYCFMDSDKWFSNRGSEGHTLDKEFIKAYHGEIHPATKEQRDALMKAMNDAGYEWDAKKKELKKLVHNRFDPKTLKAFDKVLVKGNKMDCVWKCSLHSHFDANYRHSFCANTGIYKMCIPYNDETKHLVGTTEEAPEYYRYWED